MLKGQAKTDYQREYMRRKRAGSNRSNTIGLTDKLKVAGLTLDGNKLGVQPELAQRKAEDALLYHGLVQPIPLYNPAIHRPGDTVMMQSHKKFIKVTIPDIDADGHPF